MRRVVVRYRVKADRLEEHERLVAEVFAELARVRPAGFAYQALRLDDGATFVHVASMSSAAPNPLLALPSFQAFSANIADRCDERPVSSPAAALGAYQADDTPA